MVNGRHSDHQSHHQHNQKWFLTSSQTPEVSSMQPPSGNFHDERQDFNNDFYSWSQSSEAYCAGQEITNASKSQNVDFPCLDFSNLAHSSGQAALDRRKSPSPPFNDVLQYENMSVAVKKNDQQVHGGPKSNCNMWLQQQEGERTQQRLFHDYGIDKGPTFKTNDYQSIWSSRQPYNDANVGREYYSVPSFYPYNKANAFFNANDNTMRKVSDSMNHMTLSTFSTGTTSSSVVSSSVGGNISSSTHISNNPSFPRLNGVNSCEILSTTLRQDASLLSSESNHFRQQDRHGPEPYSMTMNHDYIDNQKQQILYSSSCHDEQFRSIQTDHKMYSQAEPDDYHRYDMRPGQHVNDTHYVGFNGSYRSVVENDSSRSHGHRFRGNRGGSGEWQEKKEKNTILRSSNISSVTAGSDAIRRIIDPVETDISSHSSSNASLSLANRLSLERLSTEEGSESAKKENGGLNISSLPFSSSTRLSSSNRPILPPMKDIDRCVFGDDATSGKEENDHDYPTEEEEASFSHFLGGIESSIDTMTTNSKKRDWLLRMNRRLTEIPIGDLDPSLTPIAAIMNGWSKTRSANGATMVETWLKRVLEEYDAGNHKIIPTNKMFTMAVDAWAKSGEGVNAAQRAETILKIMNKKYESTRLDQLRPTTGIFNAILNCWARSKEKFGATRAEQILRWMDNLNIMPDKYTFNTVIHAYAKIGAAKKAQDLLENMHTMYRNGNQLAKPDTITYNVVINSLAKSGAKHAAKDAERLLEKMHKLYEDGDVHVKPNVVSYGSVIDAYAKSGAAARADALLARMIKLNQMDPVEHSDLLPNTYVFNSVINAHSKSKEHDSAMKAEEMLLAMNELHLQGLPNIKADAFTYTAVIDAYAKSNFVGAASRAEKLLDQMESKYLAGDIDLKPNTFTYNAVINALAKSGEPSGAAKAEKVLQNMVNRHRHGACGDITPTTINFNSVLDAVAKCGGGRKAAERSEEILQWMDQLYKSGNKMVRPDTISFNAVIDSWARSGDRMAGYRAEQILNHMDYLYRNGNELVKADTYTYNTIINCHAKSGSAKRAEKILEVMKHRYLDGDDDFKPNCRTYTSVIDAIAKSGEKGAARRAEEILNDMIKTFESTGDLDSKPNVHTANAVCNACAFTKRDEDRKDALQIAFRVYDWLTNQPDMDADSYTYTILLSVCSNLLPREDQNSRFSHAKSFFRKCCENGYVNDYVLRKLKQTVSEQEYLILLDYQDLDALPVSWIRNVSHKMTRHSRSKGQSTNSFTGYRRNKSFGQRRKSNGV